jgi:phosphate/sulfate permease
LSNKPQGTPEMKRSKLPLLSYMTALVIGAILFAVLWKWLFGSASSTVVIAGIAGVVIAVSVFLLWNEFKKPNDLGG